jgi:cytidylate kinase
MAPDPAPARPVVTISAPYGTGGSVIGPELAERLGVPFVDRAIPVSVSRRLQIPLEDAIEREEVPHDSLSRWAAYFAPAVQLFGGMAIGDQALPADQAFLEATEEALHEHATGGAVILGRAGAIVLRDAPRASHIRLTGPVERRAEIGSRLTGVDRRAAEQELRASDVARETYVKHWYRTDPADPSHYHLVIDSTVVPIDCTVELILIAVEAVTGITSGSGEPPRRTPSDRGSESA